MSNQRDYYQVLGVPRSASQEEIRAKFRRLALEYHPDRNREPGAQEKFKEINEAYQVLSDPQKRAEYDRFGRVGVGAG
ncbi:MAG: DnaJ domain-containing protein, partial [Chloroflexi bacterium]|nr:DnaJ domain-containing protein [Chloroflexota bacterium]